MNKRNAPWSSNLPLGTSSVTTSTESSSELDAIMASKLNGLTLQERDSGLHDLHGVSDKVGKEDFEMLQIKIQQMNQILHSTNYYKFETFASGNLPTTTSLREGGVIGADGGGGFFNNVSTPNNLEHHAYQMAINLNSKYVEGMKLICLRAESYDPEAAAGLLKRFFHRKLQLFGQDCLAREITQQDLIDYDPEHAETLLRKGLVRLLPYRDRAGRAIVFVDGKVNGECISTGLVSRVMFYMCMVPLRDIETQKQGVVVIYYGLDQTKRYAGRTSELMSNWNAIPWRTVAYHSCVGAKDIALASLQLYFSKVRSSGVCRTRLHTGTPMEIIYELLTFGIPQDAIPVNTDGSRDMSWHDVMLHMIKRRENYYSSKTTTKASSDSLHQCTEPLQHNQQLVFEGEDLTTTLLPFSNPFDDEDAATTISSISRTKGTYPEEFVADLTTIPFSLSNPFDEEEDDDDDDDDSTAHNHTGHNTSKKEEKEEEEESILVPNPKDILLGKGRRPNSHVGNMKFHSLLEEHRDAYDSALKTDKTTVSQSLLQKLKANGCRFLEEDKTKGGYIVVPDKIARQKITHGFRNIRIRNKKRERR